MHVRVYACAWVRVHDVRESVSVSEWALYRKCLSAWVLECVCVDAWACVYIWWNMKMPYQWNDPQMKTINNYLNLWISNWLRNKTPTDKKYYRGSQTRIPIIDGEAITTRTEVIEVRIQRQCKTLRREPTEPKGKRQSNDRENTIKR